MNRREFLLFSGWASLGAWMGFYFAEKSPIGISPLTGAQLRELRQLYDPSLNEACAQFLEELGGFRELLNLLKSRRVLGPRGLDLDRIEELALSDPIIGAGGWMFSESELALYALAYRLMEFR